MLFENLQINTEELPKVADLEFKGLAPNYLKVSYIGNAIFFTILLVGMGIIFTQTNLMDQAILRFLLPSLWLLWTIVGFALVRKIFQIKGYALREKDILFRKGLLFRTTTAIPFNRVQHCEIKQGPIERYFDLNTLEIFTAGGQSSDLRIPGLVGEEAQQLKEFILKNTAEDV